MRLSGSSTVPQAAFPRPSRPSTALRGIMDHTWVSVKDGALQWKHMVRPNGTPIDRAHEVVAAWVGPTVASCGESPAKRLVFTEREHLVLSRGYLGSHGALQWKQWCALVEKMVRPSGSAWCALLEAMVRPSGNNGAPQWNFMVRCSGNNVCVLPAKAVPFCGG